MAKNTHLFQITARGRGVLEFAYNREGKETHVAFIIKGEKGGYYSKSISYIEEEKSDIEYYAPSIFAEMSSEAKEYFAYSAYSYYRAYENVNYRNLTGENWNSFLKECKLIFARIGNAEYKSYFASDVYYCHFCAPYYGDSKLEKEVFALSMPFFRFGINENVDREMLRLSSKNADILIKAIAEAKPSEEILSQILSERKAIKDITERLRQLARKNERETVVACASNIPVFNDPEINKILLEDNDGIGIEPSILTAHFIKMGEVERLIRIARKNRHYSSVLFGGNTPAYLFALSSLKSQGKEKEAIEFAKFLAKAAPTPMDFAYLSSFYSREELEKEEKAGRFESNFRRRYKEPASFAEIALSPSSIYTPDSDLTGLPRLLGSKIISKDYLVDNLFDLNEVKKETRGDIKECFYLHYGNNLDEGGVRYPFPYFESAVMAGAILNDGVSLRLLEDENAFYYRTFPSFYGLKARVHRENPKKFPEVKPYGRKGE